MQKTLLVVLSAFFAVCNADLCQQNFTLGELPNSILEEVLSVVTKGVISDFVGCPSGQTISPDKINLFLWNAQNPTNPILLDKNNPTGIDPTLKTVFLVHGWLCNVTNERVPQLRDAYLQRYGNLNIIAIDWSFYSIDLYVNSFCNIPLIAQLVGGFICKLNSVLSVSIDNVHLVGHSMGGQMSGIIGQEIQAQCAKSLGRITALDPAGPLYQTVSNSRRLDKTDAQMVDVIHSNAAQLGFYGPCGTIDFFPNCGYYQTGCLEVGADTDPTDLLSLPTGTVACNHLRSVDYMIESLNSDNFIATSCDECQGLPIVGPCIPDLFNPSQVVMGEDTPSTAPDTKYWLSTNGESPYAEG